MLTPAMARRLWDSVPVPVDDGLSPAELDRIERELRFAFNPDHRALLMAGLPRGGRWPDWRASDLDPLRRRLAEPVEGVLFDVLENDFWWRDWGPRPARLDEALALARAKLSRVPILVPLYGHRFCPALPGAGLPVLSVVQTDVMIYGANLADYLAREFGHAVAHDGPVRTVPFWSELAA